MKLRAAVPLLALLAVPSLAAQPSSSAPVPSRFQGKLQPCTPPGFLEPVLCGSLPVWENRGKAAGRKIDLNVVVAPAYEPVPAPDPVFYFSGGPGQAGTDLASWMSQLAFDLRRDRDLVFIDQRGTGKSNPLNCELPGGGDDLQASLRPMFPVEPLRACLAELQKKADLTQYTNEISMEDTDDVRAWLGYDRINLEGGSYGGRAALVYLRKYPQRVRSVVISSLVPVDMLTPLNYARSAQTALDRLLDDCGAEETCRQAFPDLRKKSWAVLERFDRGPVKTKVAHPKTGQPVEVELSRTAFVTALRVMQYSPYLSRRIPLYLHRAYEGDYGPMIRQIHGRASAPDSATGLYFSITCAEDVARIPAGAYPGDVAGTFLGDDRMRQQREICSFWPRSKVSDDFWEPVESTAPVLFINGWLDPITPPELAARAAKHLPNSLLVVIRDAAHGSDGLVKDDCHLRLEQDFFRNGSPAGLDTSCVREMKRPPFLLREEPAP